MLDQVSLQIGAGEFVGIVGCTGCGKTTLLKAMAGLLEVQDGEILLDGENIFSRRFDRAVLRRKVGMVFLYPAEKSAEWRSPVFWRQSRSF